MKKSIFGVLTLLAALGFSSCANYYYQVATTKAVDPSVFTTKTDEYVYEDENVRITYNMWDTSGDRGFAIYNKTNYYIHVSSFESCMTTALNTGNAAYSDFVTGEPTNTGVVAPKTSRLVGCDQKITTSVFKSEGLKERVRHSESKSFTEQDSPMRFANHITYYFYPGGANAKIERTVVHTFYIDKLTNYSANDFMKLKERFATRYDIFDNGKRKEGVGKTYQPVNRKGFYNMYLY